jgi:hypothetical protein
MAGFLRLSFSANGFARHLFGTPAAGKLVAGKSEIAQGALVELGDFLERRTPLHVVPDHPDQ